VYESTGANALSAEAAQARPLVYVPNSKGGSVTVIDPATYTVVNTVVTGRVPQHVVPSRDMATLWATNNEGNTLTPIDPRSGMFGKSVAVTDPYNLYFTPDGQYAMVIAEAQKRVDLRDPKTMKVVKSIPVTCDGLDHVDFTADEQFAVASCEFSGQMVKLDLTTYMVAGYLTLPKVGRFHAMPQDVRLSPDGRVFYVADMNADGVHIIDAAAFTHAGFIETGRGAHGFVMDRGGARIFVANRGWHMDGKGPRGPGSVSVLDPKTQLVTARWPIPEGGSPDMGNVSADGKELWLAGRYDNEVYVLDTSTGKLLHRITVGREPHGLCVWPQPGRYSLGHTGNMR
jgi:YVTN family beta-propeller protein